MQASGLCAGKPDRLVEQRLVVHDAAGLDAAACREDQLRLGVLDPGRQFLGREAAEHHRMHRADPRAGQHRDHGFRHHRHIEDDAVALGDAEIGHHGGERLHLVQQLRIGEFGDAAGQRRIVDQRHLIGAAAGDMTVERVVAGVDHGTGEPAGRHGRGDAPNTRRCSRRIRRADDRRRAERAQHPARCRGDRLQLDHGEAKVLITDREFSAVIEAALAGRTKPLVIDYRRPEFPHGAAGQIDYEEFLAEGDPGLRLACAGRRMGRDRAQLHLGHDRRSQGRRLSSSRRLSERDRQCLAGRCRAIRSICGRCRCSTATAGAFPGRCRRVAGTHVCLRWVRAKAIYDAIAEHKVTHLCGAPIVMSTSSTRRRRRAPAAAACRAEFITAAAPPPAAVLAAWKNAGFNVTHVYGLTETYGPAVVNDWNRNGTRCRSRSRREEGAPGRALSRARRR
jgi:hypothetical protein